MRRRNTAAAPSSVREATVRFVVTIALAAAALLVFASPAQAQFGRLKKAASDAVKEAAGVPKDEPAKSGSSSKPFEATITAERVDLMLAALAPLTEEARKQAALNDQRAAFSAKRQAWEKCTADAAKRVTSISPDYLEKVPAFTEKSTALTERMMIAQQGKLSRLAAALEDSLQVLGNLMSMSMSGAKCGPAVYKPIALIDADVAQREASSGEVGEDGRYVSHGSEYTLPESARRGLTHRQFSVIRERIALYAMGEIGKSRESNFSPEERAALDAKGNELRALAPFFRDGTLRWTNGGDLKRW